MIINLFFFFLYTFISKLNCLYNNEIANATLNMEKKLDILDSNNYITLNFNDEIKKTLSVGKVYEETLSYSKKYIFNFNKLDNKNNTLYFHFYPLDDCHIKILSNDTSVKIKNKSNYNNDLFYTKINSVKILYSISYKIEPTNYLNKDSNSICHLIINSFSKSNKNNNIPILNIIEKKQTFLHFDKNLKKIRLFYNLKNKKKESIVFSFFIKDKVKFNVTLEKTGLNKTISYIDKFIIKKDLISNKENISILITLKEKDKESDVIIKVTGDNSKLNYLQRNFLNLEFILSEEETQYYYMEVYKNEKGEIMLHDKRKNGKLASKIFNENRFPTKSDFKKISNEFDDEFNIYSQKLSFNTTECKNISNKCYLLITYFGPYHSSNITGTEYTLLTRIWDKFEFIPQIVNIPLNEYVFGNFDEKSVNHHYYTVFIPEDSDNITIEIHGYEIKAYAINEIKKINAISKNDDIYDLQYNGTRGQIIILKKDNFKLKSFKSQYISFSFFREDRKLNNISYYYFRILQPDSINNVVIYPLDSNFENLCKPELKFNSCYFLLKNDYNELSQKQSIHELYDDEQYYFYKAIKKKDGEDYYSINLNKTKFSGYPINKNSLKLNGTNSYLIIKINYKFNYKSNYKSFLTISSAFTEIEPSIQIYSYKLINFYKGKPISFKLDKAQQYKLKIINNVKQDYKGEIRFKKDNVIKDNIVNNFGKQMSYPINKDVNILEFYSNNKNHITQFIKFDYKRPRKNVEEINYGTTTKPIFSYDEFPVIFYIKHVRNNSLDFNIQLDRKIKIEKIDISGYIVDFHSITKIDQNKDILNENLDNKVTKGIYDNETKTGIIEFNAINENIRDIDIYYIVKISISNSKTIKNNANLDSRIVIDAYSREDKNHIVLPGKYIRGMFDLEKNTKGKIYYIKECYECTIIFSSNYKNLKIVIDNNTTSVENKSLGYAKIYKIKGYIDKFRVKLIDNENITSNNNSIININYIFKYEIKDNIDMHFLETNITYQKLTENYKENKRDVAISFFYNKRKNNNSKYSYYLRLYQESEIKNEKEDLNTLAITSPIFKYYDESIGNNYNNKINFIISNLSNDESYQGYLLIKRNNTNGEEYRVQNFTIGKKKDYSLILVILILLSLIIIIILIFSIYLMRVHRKNKKLEDKVRDISFKVDDDNDSLNEDINNKVHYI